MPLAHTWVRGMERERRGHATGTNLGRGEESAKSGVGGLCAQPGEWGGEWGTGQD